MLNLFLKEPGLIAQEVLKVPELDHLVIKLNDADGLYSVNDMGLIPYLKKRIRN